MALSHARDGEPLLPFLCFFMYALIADPTYVGGVPTLVTPYAADDDGGYFRWRLWSYYQTGALALIPKPTAPANLRVIRGGS